MIPDILHKFLLSCPVVPLILSCLHLLMLLLNEDQNVSILYPCLLERQMLIKEATLFL